MTIEYYLELSLYHIVTPAWMMMIVEVLAEVLAGQERQPSPWQVPYLHSGREVLQ